jgi:hypothetical protein
MIVRTLLAAFLLAIISQTAFGQGIVRDAVRDYVDDYPVHYQPQDPWTRGVIFRNHMGHGGLFYNCDQQECKRYSPYIVWKSQPYNCLPFQPVHTTISQQICEVKQRILWGGSGCFSCETPACAHNSCNCQSCLHGHQHTTSHIADAGNLPSPLLNRIVRSSTIGQAGSVDRRSNDVYGRVTQPMMQSRQQTNFSETPAHFEAAGHIRMAQRADFAQQHQGVNGAEKLDSMPKRGMKVIRQ